MDNRLRILKAMLLLRSVKETIYLSKGSYPEYIDEELQKLSVELRRCKGKLY